MVEIRLNEAMENYEETCKALEKNGFKKQDSKQIFIKELKDKETAWESLKKEARKNVEKAEENLDIESIEDIKDLKEFYKLYKNKMKYFGAPQHPFKYFRNIWGLLHPDKVKGFNCKFKEEVIASKIFFHTGNQIYFIYQVSNPRYLNKKPNDYLYWKSMEWGIENGYKTCNFGQVNAEAKEESHAKGIYNFKKKWTPKLFQKTAYTRNIEIENKEHHKKRELWKKSPEIITNILGPFISPRKGY